MADDLFGAQGITVLTGRETCTRALRNPGLSSNPGGDSASVLFMDGAEHSRVRAVLRELIATLEPLPTSVRDEITGVVTPLAEKPGFDLVADFARPVAAVVTGALLGVTPDASFLTHLEAVSGNLDVWSTRAPDRAAQTSALRIALLLNRSDPEPGRGVALLRAARDEGRITDDELLLTPVTLAHAAYENSMNFLALAGLDLARDHRLAERFRSTTDATAFVRDLAGHLCPARFVLRLATESVELPGITLAPGTKTAIGLGPGETGTGLPFGLGRHACPGSAVAVAEADVALRALAEILATGYTAGEPHKKPHPAFHGLARASVLRLKYVT